MNTPAQITAAAENAGLRKAALPTRRTLVSAILAGAFIAFGGILSVIVGRGMPELAAANPSLARFASGAVFPIGLILVVALGAELFTGNNAMLIPSLLAKRHGVGALLRNWGLVYMGNFIGAALFTLLMVQACGLLDADPWHTAICAMGFDKVYSMSWITVFLKGVGANWCVCLALWLAMAGRTLGAKMAAIWFPIMMFVTLGYEHSIANMFFIPAAMLQGADISIWDALWRNLLPATLGNIVGGALLVGMLHTRLHPAPKN